MPNAIAYCDVCGKIILPSEIAEGRATVSAAESFCPDCSHLAPRNDGVSASSLKGSRRRRAAQAGQRPQTGTAIVAGVLAMLVGMGATIGILLRNAPSSRSNPGAGVELATSAVEPAQASSRAAAVPETAVAAQSQSQASAQDESPREAAASARRTHWNAPAERPAPVADPDDGYDVRGGVAQLQLDQAKAILVANSNDVVTFRQKLEVLCRSFDGTPAAAEATRLLAEVRLPELPPERNPQLPPAEAWDNADHILEDDPRVQSLGGNWSVVNGRVRSDKATWAKAALPYLLPEEYDVRVTFSRIENSDCLLVVLGRRGRPFIFSIGGSGNSRAGFEAIRESAPDILPTNLIKSGIISNNERHEVVILVRSGCLRAYFDGAPITGCQVDDEGISLRQELRMPRDSQAGLMTWDSVYEIYSFDVKPVSGQGEFIK